MYRLIVDVEPADRADGYRMLMVLSRQTLATPYQALKAIACHDLDLEVFPTAQPPHKVIQKCLRTCLRRASSHARDGFVQTVRYRGRYQRSRYRVVRGSLEGPHAHCGEVSYSLSGPLCLTYPYRLRSPGRKADANTILCHQASWAVSQMVRRPKCPAAFYMNSSSRSRCGSANSVLATYMRGVVVHRHSKVAFRAHSFRQGHIRSDYSSSYS